MTPRSPFLCLLTVGFLGTALLIALAGIIWLASLDHQPPVSLVALAGAAVGALAAYLAQVQDPYRRPPGEK